MQTNQYKELLEKEFELLEKELKGLGKVNPNNSEDWVATESSEMKANDDRSDENDNADELEELGERNAILSDLEIRYQNVKKALKRIEEKTFGKCEICGEKIETARLQANPAATTCMEHMGN